MSVRHRERERVKMIHEGNGVAQIQGKTTTTDDDDGVAATFGKSHRIIQLH